MHDGHKGGSKYHEGGEELAPEDEPPPAHGAVVREFQVGREEGLELGLETELVPEGMNGCHT